MRGDISIEDAKRLAEEMRLRHVRPLRAIPPRLRARLLSSCSHHVTELPEFTSWRWHLLARNLGLASIQ